MGYINQKSITGRSYGPMYSDRIRLFNIYSDMLNKVTTINIHITFLNKANTNIDQNTNIEVIFELLVFAYISNTLHSSHQIHSPPTSHTPISLP